MRIIFFGTSSFAVPSLETLIKNKLDIACVVTQPDRKKGRDLLPAISPVKNIAIENKIPVFQPESLKTIAVVNTLKQYNADIFIVIAYGQILPKEVLNIPKIFSINLHGSLLPKYRGAAPINWAVINGEKATGVTVMKMSEELDAGPIILRKETQIKEDEDAEQLFVRLANVGASALLEVVNHIKENNYYLQDQDKSQATYAPKLKKEDGLIDWKKDALSVHNAIRGLLPWPGSYTTFKKKLLKIFKTKIMEKEKTSRIGCVSEIKKGEGIIVETGKGGRVLIEELQLEGGKRMGSYDFALGHQIQEGDILGK